MSKSRQSKKTNPRTLYIAAGLVVAVIAVVALLASRGTASTVSAQDISPADYQSQFVASSTSHLLIDVRTAEEFASGHIRGSVNIPVESLQSRLNEVPANQPIVVYCRSGNRSALASDILKQAGYSSIYDLGGIIDWTAQGFPVE